jgi:alkaline phosphatase
VSGSAPTASAYATGVRTFMGAISVGPDSVPVKTVLELAMERGKSTGLMTTTAIQDATPAAFGAHAVSRTRLADISRQFIDRGITVLVGGGRRFFRPDMQGGNDLIAEARGRYTYVETVEELMDLRPDTVDMLLGLLAETEMGVVADRGAGTLRKMTETALDILDRDPDGFFLMVENEESDTQSHDNMGSETITTEMLDFDEVVRLALDYQAEHPGTLVLVTGDHETGGLSLPYGAGLERAAFAAWATPGHTGVLIPIFASGPGAERFGGIIRNDQVGQVLLELLGAEGR